MTTDITELAQSLKAAAEKATPGQWERGDGKHGGELLVYCDDALGSAVCEATSEYNAIPKYQRIDNLDFIALANPANVTALVEALEKAQQERDEFRNRLKLERSILEDADKRIAELESRTVKLPQRLQPGADGYDDWYVHSDDDGEYLKVDDVLAMLTAAGIKAEAE
ncbi:ead/Ea22-like family protein [Klebsiella grimontii]|uniref:ead/Ea22-like family protein n=1 Tax=Klebsiella grimontii TaxID=2058152 RepID=UPI001865A77C|nr:ead/Ea22-like family protein [Klebsiella grimontii]